MSNWPQFASKVASNVDRNYLWNNADQSGWRWKMAKMKSGLATCASTRAAPESMPHWARRSQLLQPFARGQSAFAYFSWLLRASVFKAMQVFLQHKKFSPLLNLIFWMIMGCGITKLENFGLKICSLGFRGAVQLGPRGAVTWDFENYPDC